VESIACIASTAYDPSEISVPTAIPKGTSMKKLLIILILAAIGIAVAKRVRDA
jgi:hypothetical protein